MASLLDMHGTLLVRPLPMTGEGLHGYFLRLSEDNGLLPEVDLFMMLFGSHRHAAATRSRLVHAADATGVSFAALDDLGSRGLADAAARTCRFAGHRVALTRLRSQRCAICPKCIQATQALHASWELTAVTACPTHGCWLIDQCPRCKAPLSWRRLGVATCRCGFDLRGAEASPAPAPVCALMATLAERLGEELPTRAGRQFGFPAKLDSMPVNQLLGIFHLLTNVKLRRASSAIPEMKNASSELRAEAATACTAADALREWPRGWRALQGRVNAAHFDDGPFEQGGIVTYNEALAPLLAIGQLQDSVAAEYPAMLRSEARAFLSGRVIRVGRHRLYATGRLPPARRPGAPRLVHLDVSVKHDDVAQCRFSELAARELLRATPHQLELLKGAGVLTSAQRPWSTGAELDRALHSLGERGQRLFAAKDRHQLVALSQISTYSGEALAKHLRDIRAGKTPCFRWPYFSPASLGNVFVSAAAASRHRDARHDNEPRSTVSCSL